MTFAGSSTEPARLLFLLVTPAEQTESQLALLSQVADMCRDASIRERLFDAATAAEIIEVIRTSADRPAA